MVSRCQLNSSRKRPGLKDQRPKERPADMRPAASHMHAFHSSLCRSRIVPPSPAVARLGILGIPKRDDTIHVVLWGCVFSGLQDYVGLHNMW